MMMSKVVLITALAAVASGAFLPNQGLLPLGNLRTVDNYEPGYDFSLFPTQVFEIQAATAAKMNFTDHDIFEFLTNVECLEGVRGAIPSSLCSYTCTICLYGTTLHCMFLILCCSLKVKPLSEGQFDTYGAFGVGFNDDLTLGGPTPIGAQKANLSEPFQAVMEEVALSEQGHVLTTRHGGSALPCPLVNFTAFDQVLAAAYGLPAGSSLTEIFGTPFNPFLSDETYMVSVLTLEELGATGNKGLASVMTNPVNQDILGGLAASATAFAAAERLLLFTILNNTVPPTNETVKQVFSRISALRDFLDGPQFDDQGLVNTDPRTIAVPDQYINLFPTDIHGLTFSRTPAQAINFYTLGNPQGVGVFFPNGLVGPITTPSGYDVISPADQDIPAGTLIAGQESVSALGAIPPPITAAGPSSVVGETDLTQATGGPLEDSTAATRGLITVAPQQPLLSTTPTVTVSTPTGGSTGPGTLSLSTVAAAGK